MTLGFNCIQVCFSLLISTIIIAGSLLNMFEPYLPEFFAKMFRYGKFSGGKSKLDVPKSWFKHFYVFSSIYMTSTFLIAFAVYIFGSQPPEKIVQGLDYFGGPHRHATVTKIEVLLALALLSMQCCRRFYDTHWISVFGKNATMNISHYIIGFSHYLGAGAAILNEAPIFAPTSKFSFGSLQVKDYLATVLFLWAWYHQYKVTVILANLRKNPKGKIVSQEYKLPQGDWFNYVSSPHSTAEILMYFALTIILWNNWTWFFVFVWVVANQVETMMLSHWWYEKTFADFPSSRKILIPFVY